MVCGWLPAVAIAALAMGASSARQAQSRNAPPAPPAFEVVSIKPGSSAPLMSLIQSGRVHSRIDDARVDLGSIPLSVVIQMAYRLPDDRISGPGWLADARFDIMAKLPAGASKSKAPEMLQSMLAERFHLAVHHDRRLTPVYELVVGKGPLKLKESANDGSELIPCSGGPPPGHHVCHKVSMEQLADHLTRLAGTNSTLAPMGGSASLVLDRPVIDMTGLKGVYDFLLDYGRAGGRGGRGGDADPANDVTEVSIVDGLRQLGFRLKPAKHAFDYLVIDHVDRVPTEN